MQDCIVAPKTKIIPADYIGDYWLVPVNAVEDVTNPDYDHAYITPDNSVFVLSHDGSGLVPIGSGGGGGEPTHISNTDNLLRITGSGTYTVTVDVNEENLTDFIFEEVRRLVPCDGGECCDLLDALIDRSIVEARSDTVTTIGGYAFQSATSLTTVDFPNATTIGSSAFRDATSLEIADFPLVTNIGQGAFYNATSLTTANFPNALSISETAFRATTSLTTAIFPSVKTIGNSAFLDATSLTTADFPSATSIGDFAFYNATSLEIADFPLVTNINSSAFSGATSLEALVLRAPTVAALNNTNAFANTPIASGTGYIFVPDDLVASYKTATNWSTYASKIRPLTDMAIPW